MGEPVIRERLHEGQPVLRPSRHLRDIARRANLYKRDQQTPI
jgi:hypothetical protein